MKNLKFYSFFTFLIIISNLLFSSCEKDEDKTQNVVTLSNNQSSVNSCDILGTFNVTNGTYRYDYTSNSGNTTVNWTITPISAGTILSGQGTSTITVSYNSSCTLSAFGSGGTRGICEEIKSIVKN